MKVNPPNPHQQQQMNLTLKQVKTQSNQNRLKKKGYRLN
jgi:hypothetical protein